MITKADHSHIDMLARAAVGVLADLPNYATVEYDIEHTRNMLNLYLGLDGLACFFEEHDGEVIGLFMGMVAPQWFSPTLEMSELMFWVRSDFRTTPLARLLIKTMEQWAIEKGAKKLIIAAASGYETARIEKFYNRMGYKTCALMSSKEI
jgi:GNAT superfamily N-acetyltransferase